jgi:peroxidase
VLFPLFASVFAKIVLKPRDVSVLENGTALFNCKATGDPKPEIVWYYGRQENKFGPIPTNNSRIQVLANNSLLLTNVQKKNEGWYRCFAGNPGYLEQAMARLRVGNTQTSFTKSMSVLLRTSKGKWKT